MMRSITQRRICVGCYLHAAVVVLLVSLNFSTATYNPAQHPQNPSWNPVQQEQYEQQQQQQQQHVPYQERYSPQQAAQHQWQAPARGGSTMVAQPPPVAEFYPIEPQEEIFQPPKILLKHMSMALRLTSEWNRRLLNGVNRFKFWKRTRSPSSATSEQPLFHPPTPQQGAYGTLPVNVHPSRSWHPPIPAPSPSSNSEEEELTMFHAKTPRADTLSAAASTEQRGVARWGPELLPYLEHVVELLGISADSVEIPLAMIYLDRACSVETPRSSGVPPCPFCAPRTVHRLSLASLILATQAVTGISDQELQTYYEKLGALGIPVGELQQMVDWMKGALGDGGLMVTMAQMKEWSLEWDSIFFPKQQQQQRLQQRPQEQERLQHTHQHGASQAYH